METKIGPPQSVRLSEWLGLILWAPQIFRCRYRISSSVLPETLVWPAYIGNLTKVLVPLRMRREGLRVPVLGFQNHIALQALGADIEHWTVVQRCCDLVLA